MLKFFQDRRALETVEAAITFPIALLVMLATINLGLEVFGQQAVQAAARHAARMGSVIQSCAAVTANCLSCARPNPQVTILAPGGRVGAILKIRVSGEIPNYFGGGCPAFSPVCRLTPSRWLLRRLSARKVGNYAA